MDMIPVGEVGRVIGPNEYCVNFSDARDETRACDWRWPENKPVWTMSTRASGECQWYSDGPLTEEGRSELLKRFRLKAIADQLPLEKIATMSPAHLVEVAEALEAFTQRQPIYTRHAIASYAEERGPFSDRIGGHIPARLAA